jgi:hypothetical protein
MEPINKLFSLMIGGALVFGTAGCQSQVLPDATLATAVINTIAPPPGTRQTTPIETQSATSIIIATPMLGIPQPSLFGAGMDQVSTSWGLTQMVAAKMDWVRLPGVDWASVETTQGVYSWSALSGLETDLRNASSNGIKVILLVHHTPYWARKYAGTGPSCGPIAADKMDAFGDFMQALVARYSVAPYNVKNWEIWNEEDAPYVTTDQGYGCWGDPSDAYYGGGYFAELMKVVYPLVKAVDTQAQVLLGGILMDCDPRIVAGCTAGKFLEGILRNGGGSSFDGVSFHGYDYYDYLDWSGTLGHYGNLNWGSTWDTTGSVTIAKAEFIKSVLSAYGVTGKYLMNTESALVCGDMSGAVPPPYSNYCVTTEYEVTKAYYVAEAYAAAAMEGLRANTWYSVLGWRHSQLLNSNLSPTSAYYAYVFARNEVRDSTYLGVVSSSDVGGATGVKGYKFQRGDRQVWVVWTMDGNGHTVSFASAPLAAWDALGGTVTPATTMSITSMSTANWKSLLYLEWNP